MSAVPAPSHRFQWRGRTVWGTVAPVLRIALVSALATLTLVSPASATPCRYYSDPGPPTVFHIETHGTPCPVARRVAAFIRDYWNEWHKYPHRVHPVATFWDAGSYRCAYRTLWDTVGDAYRVARCRRGRKLVVVDMNV